MAQKETPKAFGDLMSQARGMLAVNPMIAPQMEQFWKAQDEVLEEAEAYSKAWFERRHDAAQSALETVRKVGSNGADLAAAMQAMVEWQQHSFQRMAQDMQQWVDLCTRCAARVSDAEMEAGKESLEEVEKRTKSTAKQKHATPV
jgi:hypothetical protein